MPEYIRHHHRWLLGEGLLLPSAAAICCELICQYNNTNYAVNDYMGQNSMLRGTINSTFGAMAADKKLMENAALYSISSIVIVLLMPEEWNKCINTNKLNTNLKKHRNISNANCSISES